MSEAPSVDDAKGAVRASGRGNRNPTDFYATTPEAGEALVDLVRKRLVLPDAPRILEPTAGDGTLLLQLCEGAADVLGRGTTTAVELSGIWSEELSIFDESSCPTDFMAWADHNRDRRFDLIPGNPPYSIAMSVLRHAWDLLAPGGYVVFLLRHGFLESNERFAWHKAHPLTGMRTLHARQHFRLNAAGKRGTDKWSSAWMVWQKPRANGGQDMPWYDTW